MRWTIGRKLMLSSIMVILLICFIGFLNIYALNQFDASIKEIIEKEQPILTSVSHMRFDLLTSRLKLNLYTTTGNKAHLQSVNTIFDHIENEHIIFFEREITRKEERDMLNDIKSTFNSYKSLVDNVASFYEKNSNETETISTKKLRIDSLLENALITKLNLLYDRESDKIVELGELSRKIYSRSFLMLISLSIITIIIIGINSFLILRSIVNPVVEMAKIVPNITKGNFNKVIDIKSKDEIGELASAFNQMTVDLKKYKKNIEEHSKLLERKVKKRTKELNKKVEELTRTKSAMLNMMGDLDETNKQLLEVQKELKKSFGELKKLDKEKDEFISIAAHELKTPMATIHGFSQLLSDEKVEDTETRNRYLKIMEDETTRLSKMVTEILDLSRIDLGSIKFTIEDVNVIKLLEDVKNEMSQRAEGKGLKFDLKIDSNLPSIKTDKEKLKQILINIIDNAIKYTEKDGIRVEAFAEDDHVKFSVADTGIGISKEHFPKIFTRFYQVESPLTRKVGGTGLGLSICKELVQKLSGKIWFDSKEGKGSTFYFTLPINFKLSK